jgi:Uma2 family endonuclease
MTVATEQVLTAEAFWQLAETTAQRELVQGEVRESMPPGGRHGAIAAELSMQLRLWAREGAGGCVGVESGFVLARHPDTVRAPDVYYVREEHLPASGIPDGFWDQAPDLAVEVVSASESAEEIRDKVRDYLQAGTGLVWVIYPRSREVVVHTPDGLARTYGAGDVLQGFESLPGFNTRVAELLAD